MREIDNVKSFLRLNLQRFYPVSSHKKIPYPKLRLGNIFLLGNNSACRYHMLYGLLQFDRKLSTTIVRRAIAYCFLPISFNIISISAVPFWISLSLFMFHTWFSILLFCPKVINWLPQLLSGILFTLDTVVKDVKMVE